MLLIGSVTSMWAEDTLLIQGFESPVEVHKWPGNIPGQVAIVDEWHSDGDKCLKIDAGLMATLETFKTKNWKKYDKLRLHFNNTGDTAATIGFEMTDKHGQFRERHRSGFGLAAGGSTVDIEMSGALWSGEENKP